MASRGESFLGRVLEPVLGDFGAARAAHLDAVRGVAVLSVMAGHFLYGAYPFYVPLVPGHPVRTGGGLLGVQLFFVLSGFLITGRLLAEHSRSGTIHLHQFYLRRLRRLYPPLLASTVAFVLLGFVVGLPTRAMLGDVLQAVTYTTNLHALFPMPRTAWLQHYWSLASEEQFYLVWPALLVMALRSGTRRAAVACLLVVGGTVFARLAVHNAEVIYEAMRWDALMVGVFLALVRTRIPRLGLVVGVMGYVFFASIPWPALTTWSYLATAMVCGCVVLHSETAVWARSRTLIYMGRVSYSLYLWHVLLLRPGMPAWLALVLTMLASHLSFLWIEKPFMSLPVRHTADGA